MPYLNHNDFKTVQTALNELVNNRQYSDLHGDDTAMLAEALKLMTDAKAGEATPAMLAAAKAEYGSNEIEFDDTGAGTSEAVDGVWVQAWVWMPREIEEDEDV